jgi:hypothetical protein
MLYLAISICLSLLLLATVVRSKMAKISSPNNEYPIKSNPASGDKVIGTDVSDGNATKNFTVGGIASFALNPANGNVVNSVSGLGPISTSPATGNVAVSLDTVSGVQGAYTHANVTVDQYGRVVSASTGTPVESVNGIDGNVTLSAGDGASVVTDPTDPQNIIISTTGGGGGSGSVTQVDTGTGLDGGPITTTGTINLADTAVTAGDYTNADITVDAQGRITAASNGDGQPNQDLQSVLDTGQYAVNRFISLSGSNTGFTALTGAATVQDVTWSGTGEGNTLLLTGELELREKLKDSVGSTGTYQQVLISDPTLSGGLGGVQWVDQPIITVRVPVSSTDLINMTTNTGPEIIAAQGAGLSIQVISAAISYDFGTVAYNFVGDLGLYTAVSTFPQYTMPANVMNSTQNEFRNMNSNGSNGKLSANVPLVLRGGVATVGDGDAILEVAYRIVAI